MGIHLSTLSRHCCWWLVLLSKLVDGLGQAAVPGVAGHQHQEGHGDHLHRAGDIGQIWCVGKEAWISPPGAQRPLLRDGQLPPLVALLLALLHLGQALLGSVWLGRRHLLEVNWQRSDARVPAMLVKALLCNWSSCTFKQYLLHKAHCISFFFTIHISHGWFAFMCVANPQSCKQTTNFVNPQCRPVR